MVLTTRFMLNLQELHYARSRPNNEILFSGGMDDVASFADISQGNHERNDRLPVHASESVMSPQEPPCSSNSFRDGGPLVGQSSRCLCKNLS